MAGLEPYYALAVIGHTREEPWQTGPKYVAISPSVDLYRYPCHLASFRTRFRFIPLCD